METTADLGDLIVRACLYDCSPPAGRLCEHDQRVLPLAEAIARGFGATDDDPWTGQYLVDADYLIDRLGDGPYEITKLDTDAVKVGPDGDPPFSGALLINHWVVAFPDGKPGEAIPMIVCRIPNEF